jgi:hypothetical protein
MPQHNEDLSESMQAFENAIESYIIDTLTQFLLRLLRNGRISQSNLLAATQNALEDFGIPSPVARMLDEVQLQIGKRSVESEEVEEFDEDGE